MAFGTKYIAAFTNELNELIEIFFGFPDFEGTPIPLECSDDGLAIKSVMNDDNKLGTVIGQEANIKINVYEETPLDIFDLIAATDNAIQVTIYRRQNYNSFIFQGFIAVEDNSQPFYDPPLVLTLRALDGLSLLKGVDFVDNNGYLYTGNFTIIQWIAECLWKTGQQINLRVYFDIYHTGFFEAAALSQIFLNSNTFSKGDAFNVNELDPSIDLAALNADDAYTALEKIVRCLRCRLFLEDGKWHLVNMWEYFNPKGMSYTEYSFGSPYTTGMVDVEIVEAVLDQQYAAIIGKKQPTYPVTLEEGGEADQLIYLKLATKWNQLNYDYNQALNKICNQDLTDIGPSDRNATFDEVISSTIIDLNIWPVVNLQTQGYNAFCWTHKDGPILSPVPPSKDAFIRQVLDQNGFLYQTFLVLQETSEITFFISTAILVDAGDKFSMSVEFRTKNKTETQENQPAAYVKFSGDDGSTWWLSSFDSDEINHPTTWIKAVGFIGHQFTSQTITRPDGSTVTVDTNIWASISSGQTIPVVPGSGSIQVYLPSNIVGGGEYWFKNLSVTINPFLNGSYLQITGDYNFSGSNNNIKQTSNLDVEISDSPKRYFKGALLDQNGKVLSPIWSRRDYFDLLRFTAIMGRLIYNSNYRQIIKIEGTFKGLIYRDSNFGEHSNGFLNVFSFQDGSFPQKKFILTSFEKDYGTGTFRGVFVETANDNNDTGFVTPDNYTFNYLFQASS